MISIPHIHEEKCFDVSVECKKKARLIIKPGSVAVCTGTLTFAAYLASDAGELLLTSGVTFASSDTQVMTINASTGVAVFETVGNARVVAAWQDLEAFALVNVLGESGCGDFVTAYEVVLDNSMSMRGKFNEAYGTKFDAAKAVANGFCIQINTAKDIAGLVSFSTTALDIILPASPAITPQIVSKIQQSDSYTILKSGLDDAIYQLSQVASNTRVILIISDGESHPKLADNDRLRLVDTAKTFKESGGIIMVCGIRACGDGFALLNEIATKGFFINIFGEGAHVADTAIATLGSMMSYFCSAVLSYIYVYLYQPPTVSLPIGAQFPDPNPDPFDFEQPRVQPRYRSTKSYTATNGSESVIKSCTAFSQVSQGDADARALEQAMLWATSEL